MKRNLITGLAVAAMAIMAVGCAITDYDGIGGHKTVGEAKILGKEVAFSGFGADVDGTYAYTVKYDNSGGSGKVTINSYRNDVVGSFTREGLIDIDGDDVQGNGGILGGKFLPGYVSVDDAPGCQFGDNVTQVHIGPAGAFLCITGNLEEVDKDFELQAAFSSLDDLAGQILSGALTGGFDLSLTGVSINGVSHPVDPFAIGASVTANKVSQITVANQASFDSLRSALLANTNHMETVSLGLEFDGGLTLNLPYNVGVAFDHTMLSGL